MDWSHAVHPWAWWGWALCVAGGVSLTTNPLLALALGLAVTAVVLLRRSDDPWARSVGFYFALAGFILGLRLVFQIVLGGGAGHTVLVRLPEVRLPAWAAGVRLGGPVTAEAIAYTVYDSLRLAVMLLCLGAANALANPRRALRSVPAALYEASVAIVIALSVAPQLIESTQRVRRAQRLRGGSGRGWRAVVAVVIPVLADAVERSMSLAAGMEARGFGRTRDNRPPGLALTATLLTSMMVLTFGGFLLLNSADAVAWAVACVALGAAGVVGGLRHSGRRLHLTRYRPDPWRHRDTALCLAGGVVAVTCFALTLIDHGAMHPSTDPLAWPLLHPAMLPAALGAAAPLALTSPPAGRAAAA